MKSIKNISTSVFLIIGIVVLINILAYRFYVRLDFTADKQYTLSGTTKSVLKSIPQPITVTAYFSEDLPPDILKVRRDFRDILIEYSRRSHGKLVYEFKNPNTNQAAELEAMQNSISPVLVNIRDKDQVKQQKVYLGAVVKMGDVDEVIPFVQPGVSMEYELTTAIKKLIVTEKPFIGLIQGHGEPKLSAFQQVFKSLTILYHFQPVFINDSIYNLDKYKTLVLVAPKDSIPSAQLAQLDKFLAQGRNLFIAYNKADVNLQNQMAQSINTGLENWLKSKGIYIDNNLVVDVNCGNIAVQQQQGMFTFNTTVKFYFLPIITNFANHIITKGIEQVMFPFASSVSFSGKKDVEFIPLAMTSNKAGVVPLPTRLDINKQWTAADFPLSNISIAAILQGKLSGDTASKIVFVGDGDFAVNGDGEQPMQLDENNVNFMVNTIDWLSDETGLIELRNKEVKSRPLDVIADGKKTFLKWLNFLLPILLVVAFGFVRMQIKKRLRTKRMEERYV